MNAIQKYFIPDTAQQAVSQMFESGENAKFIAGGTDLMANRQNGIECSDILIDLSRIISLRKIYKSEEFIHIGSMVTLEEIIFHPTLLKDFSGLVKASGHVASSLIRKSATIGGNVLCENRCSYYNQSEFWRDAVGHCLKCEGDHCIATGGKKACFSRFSSDTAPMLISLNASVKILDHEKESVVPLENIYSHEGVSPTTIGRTGLILEILLPLNKKYVSDFQKLRPRESIDFASLSCSMTVDANGSLCIVMGGIDPGPVIIRGSIEDDQDALIKKLFKNCHAVENDFFPRIYRKEMVRTFISDALSRLVPLKSAP